MQLETFRGRELQAVVRHVQRTLGEDAMIVRTQRLARPGGEIVEVVAAHSAAVEAFRKRIDGGLAAARRSKGRKRVGPYVIALVGPPGAGKTTSIMKLALHPEGVGQKKVGLITLDTYRVGGVEELQTMAEIANLELEVVYHRREVRQAVARLRHCQVILVDAPGRGIDENAEWLAALEEIDADETHLVLPVGLRPEIARRHRRRLAPAGVTHVLFTKLDEVPADAGLAEMIEAVDLPARWVADGYEMPGALAAAAPRILGSLGVSESDATVLRAG